MPVEIERRGHSSEQRYFAPQIYTLHVPNIETELSPFMKRLGRSDHSLVNSIYSAAERLAEDPGMHKGQKFEHAKDIILGLTRMGELKLDSRLIDILTKIARPVLRRIFPEGIGRPSFD